MGKIPMQAINSTVPEMWELPWLLLESLLRLSSPRLENSRLLEFPIFGSQPFKFFLHFIPPHPHYHTSLTISSKVITSLALGGYHPNSATKFKTASGRYPLRAKSSTVTSPERLDSFVRSGLKRSGTCAKYGGTHPNA